MGNSLPWIRFHLDRDCHGDLDHVYTKSIYVRDYFKQPWGVFGFVSYFWGIFFFKKKMLTKMICELTWLLNHVPSICHQTGFKYFLKCINYFYKHKIMKWIVFDKESFIWWTVAIICVFYTWELPQAQTTTTTVDSIIQ